jgi:uncharacterized protein YfkK (UPF0435 family)
MKCGTTSLHEYLDLHPQIYMSRIKEPAFFIEEHNWHKGLEWYKSLFPQHSKIRGESSTSYTKYPSFDGVPRRMYDIIPDAKLIYIVRDPFHRLISQYIHRVSHYGEKRSLEEALMDIEKNDYIYYSKYYMQLERYLEYYSLANILVLDFDDLKNNTAETMQRIYQFIDVDQSFECKEFSVIYNLSNRKRRPNWLKLRLGKIRGFKKIENLTPWLFGTKIERPVLNETLKQKIADVLKNDIEQLRSLTGCSFKKWSL